MCAKTQTPTASAPPPSGRRGVALIIVLGLMAVLVILAVSFVVVMRTERLTARAFEDDFRVRELCYVALTRAMDHIAKDADTGGWAYPPWPNCTLHGGQNPQASGGTKQVHNVLEWRGDWYISSNLFETASERTNDLKWITIREGTQYVGRVTYMVVNTSGEIDANGNGDMDPMLARSIPRTIGTNVNELQLHNSLIFSLTANGTNLYNARTAVPGLPRSKPFGRAETVQDLGVVAQRLYTTGRPLQNWNWNNRPGPHYLTTFSHFPTGFAVNGQATYPPVYIGGDSAQVIGQRAAIQNQLTLPGMNFPAPQAQAITLNLLDYVDTDFIPGNAGAGAGNVYNFCTEPVPMINEIVIGSVMQDAAPNRTLTINLEVEVWYPFYGVTNPYSYSLRAAPQFEGGTFSAPAVSMALTPKAGPWACVNPAVPGRFEVFQGRWTSQAPITNATLPTSLQFPQLDVLENNSQVADGIQPNAGGMAIRVPWANYMATTPGVVSYSGWRANDPRINWYFPDLNASENSVQWSNELKQATAKVPGATLTQANFPLTTLGEDTRWHMHVRNRGDLPSAGHLGLLLYDSGKPWKTISLLGPEAKPVIDYFTVQRRSRRGVINVNTTNAPVLATAFYRMATETVPGATNGMVMDTARSLSMAQAIISARLASPRGWTNLSAIAGAGAQIAAALPATGPNVGWHDPDRESLIRNSEGVLGTRQNLFLIVLIAESRREVVNPETGALTTFRLGGQRAVAEVWRDPIKTQDPSGQWRNRMFVHFFRWLDD